MGITTDMLVEISMVILTENACLTETATSVAVLKHRYISNWHPSVMKVWKWKISVSSKPIKTNN